jgi:deoxyribodipyrimidine photo-lyase
MGQDRESLTLVWFRDDLRVEDHEALTAACGDGQVIGLWIRECRGDDGLGPRPLGGAARWWAHESLRVLETELAQVGIPLLFAAGSAADIVPQAAADLKVDAVRWSRRYAPAARRLDAQIKTDLADAGRAVHSHTGALLVEPWTVNPQGGDFYKVFTPFFNAVRDRSVGDSLPAPRTQSSPDGGPATGFGRALLGARPRRSRSSRRNRHGLGQLRLGEDSTVVADDRGRALEPRVQGGGR